MPNTQQIMRDKLADSLKEFHQWSDLIRSGEAEVTSMSIKRKPKPWVGLTTMEMEGLYQSATYMDETDYIHLLMMAEDKLKEKNEFC